MHSNGHTTELNQSFGSKSVVAVGDLYQLPCVETSRRFEEQIYKSDLWPEFAFAELTESCRVMPGEVRFSQLLSRARLGYEYLTEDDKRLLTSRMCTRHCTQCNTAFDGEQQSSRAQCLHSSPILLKQFTDTERVTTRKYNKQTTENEHTRKHCPICADDVICTALVQKVDELNHYVLDQLDLSNKTVHTVYAVDTQDRRFVITNAKHREAIDKRLTNMKRSLTMYEGMLAILTINKDTLRNYVNGTVGIITKIHTDHNGDVKSLDFLPDDAHPGTKPLTLLPEESFAIKTAYEGVAYRTQFPLLPCSAVTVHRLQGATIDPPKRLHVLLNKEIFETGQGYVALSRVRSLSQLHIWALDFEAFKADSNVHNRTSFKSLTAN